MPKSLDEMTQATRKQGESTRCQAKLGSAGGVMITRVPFQVLLAGGHVYFGSVSINCILEGIITCREGIY
jgi:hypothetical protein